MPAQPTSAIPPATRREIFACALVGTAGCVLFTALLAQVGPGEVALGMLLLVLSAFMFHTGEDLIAGFLPEIADARDMGRVSGYGWSLGYLGGMLVLGLCLVYVMAAQARGEGGRAGWAG